MVRMERVSFYYWGACSSLRNSNKKIERQQLRAVFHFHLQRSCVRLNYLFTKQINRVSYIKELKWLKKLK